MLINNMLLRNALRGFMSYCDRFYVMDGTRVICYLRYFLCRFLLQHLLAQWQESLHLMLIYRLTYTALYISTGISCYRAPFSCYLTTFFKSIGLTAARYGGSSYFCQHVEH